MKKLMMNPALFYAAALIILSSCQNNNTTTCCVLGPRNANGKILTTGEAKNISSRERCQQECEELGLSADWFNMPCEQVGKSQTEFDKGTTTCP